MKSLLFSIIVLLISTIGYSQKSYKPFLQKENQISCVIVKSQPLEIRDLKLQKFKHDKDNTLKYVATAGLVGFAGIMTVNYFTGSKESFKDDKLGYWGLIGSLSVGVIAVQIAL